MRFIQGPGVMKGLFAPPKFQDEEKNRAVRVLYITNLMGMAGAGLLALISVVARNEYVVLPLLVFAGYSLGCLLLIRQGKLDVPGLTLPIIMLVLLTYVLNRGNGVHDVGLLGYPLVIVFAGLLLGKLGVLAFTGLSMAAVAFLVYAELEGQLATPYSDVTDPTDMLTSGVFLVVLAILLYVTIDSLMQSLKRTRASEARWRALVESVPAMILTADPEGVVQYANYLEFGEPAEMVGKRIDAYLSPEVVPQVVEALSKVQKERCPERVEVNVELESGTPVWYAVNIGPVLDGGKLTGIVAVVQNITDLKNAHRAMESLNVELENRVAERTAQLEAANRELESFNYSVSHDLRAPLRALNGFSGILMEEFGSSLPEEASRLLRMVRDSAMRMNELIEGLLMLSRLNRKELVKTEVSPEMIAWDIVQVLAPGVPIVDEGRKIEWIIHPMPVCQADPGLLRQVYANLIENSLKFTRNRENVVIEIGANTNETPPAYYVRDNGVGFNMRYAEKIFGVFQRLHREEEYEGTGIGLATVQRIIHRHGGRVWFEAAPGQGATFYFTVTDQRAG